MSKQNQDVVRRLVTILSADVAGYSLLMANAEEETLKTFRDHKRIFESLVNKHRGRVFNTAGDAILAEFQSAVEAVRCATEIQSALRTANSRIPESGRVQFRIGVNLGDVIEQGQDLLGDGVNVAARLQSTSEPGGVCISGSVYDQIAGKLPLNIQALGEQVFKNIPQPVRTFSVTNATSGIRTGKGTDPEKSEFPWVMLLPAGLGVLALAVSALSFLHRASHREQVTAPVVVAEAPREEAKPEAGFAVPEKFDLSPVREASESDARWVVDAAGAEGSNARSIADAVDQALPGDVIAVRPGAYRERLLFYKNVVVRGLPGPDGKVAVRIEAEGTDAVIVTAGDVTLANLGIILHAAADSRSPSAVLEVGGNLKLRNVAVLSGGARLGTAFSLREGQASLDGSTFTGQRGIAQLGGKLECDSCVAAGNLEQGVVAFNQLHAREFTATFRNLRADHNGKQGVLVKDFAAVTFSECRIAENGASGVELAANGTAAFSGCEVSGNRDSGVTAGGSSKVIFAKGKASRNKASGFAARDTSSIEVRDAEVSGNGEFGIATADSGVTKTDAVRFNSNQGGDSSRSPASVEQRK